MHGFSACHSTYQKLAVVRQCVCSSADTNIKLEHNANPEEKEVCHSGRLLVTRTWSCDAVQLCGRGEFKMGEFEMCL